MRSNEAKPPQESYHWRVTTKDKDLGLDESYLTTP